MREFNVPNQKIYKLDRKDKKILATIHSNARMPIVEIAKKTGLPKDVVLYRLNKYKKEGLVNFYSFINPTKIGFPIYKYVNISLNNFNSDEIKLFTKYFIDHPNITYSSKTSGNFDFLIAVSAKSLLHFDKILQDIRERFSTIIKDFIIYDIVEEYQLDYCSDLIE